jgi:stage II sporulation protein P
MAIKKMKLKSKKKKRIKIKYLFYMLIIYLTFAYTFYYMIKDNNTISNEEFINILVTSGNANILSKYKTTNVVNSTMKFLFSIDFTNPPSILNNSILKFGSVKKKSETISIEYNDDYSNMDDLKSVSDYIKDPNPTDVNEPIIYLYNTHQLENYSNENLDIYGITPNVQMASYVLREKLNTLGIKTIVEESNMSEILEKNGWNYTYSYQASRQLIKSAQTEYKSLKYFIDIHRDSVSKNLSTVTINNKSYAKVLFVIGLDHSNWQPNYNFASSLNDLINSNYNGLSRGILKKTGMNVNGIYNQDMSSNCLLIEVGGTDNTIEEVYNTMEALSNILEKYIKENN